MKKYEFSYRAGDNVHFVTLYDENIQSACERVLSRKVEEREIDQSLYNYFITGWENTRFTIHVMEYNAAQSSHVAMYTPSKTRTDSILDGLI